MKRLITVQFVRTEIVEAEVIVECSGAVDAENKWLEAYEKDGFEHETILEGSIINAKIVNCEHLPTNYKAGDALAEYLDSLRGE